MPLPLKVISGVGEPLQTVSLATGLTAGDGFTFMVNVCGWPEQVTPPLKYCGVTVIVAKTGIVPLLTAGKDAIFPAPLTANPIEVVLLVQL